MNFITLLIFALIAAKMGSSWATLFLFMSFIGLVVDIITGI